MPPPRLFGRGAECGEDVAVCCSLCTHAECMGQILFSTVFSKMTSVSSALLACANEQGMVADLDVATLPCPRQRLGCDFVFAYMVPDAHVPCAAESFPTYRSYLHACAGW